MYFKILEKFPEVSYGISNKSQGSLKFGAGKINQNRRENFFKENNINFWAVPEIVHGNNVARITKGEAGKIIPAADGLITRDKNFALTVTVADCFPVFFFDPKSKAIALVHAGWRGAVLGIVAKTMLKLKKEFNLNPKNILCAIGPGIQRHHFTVKKDVLGKFAEYKNCISQNQVDLPNVMRHQLKKLGVKNANIETSPECTFCEHEKYFSFRRDKPKTVKAMLAYIQISN